MLKDRTPSRILVIGAGSIGSRHAENLAMLGVEVGLADAVSGLAEQRCIEHGYTFVSDVGHALRTGDYEAAVICTPNHLHVPIAQQAADAGLHLFVEKPLSHTLEGVARLLDTVDDNELVGMAGFNLRFEPGIRYLKDTVRFEDIAFAQIEYGSYLPSWRPRVDYRRTYSAQKALGGGIVLDDIHELDYACWFFGYPPAATCVHGRFGSLGIDVEDTAVFLLRYSDKIVTIHSDYLQRRYSRHCKLCTRDGCEIRWIFGDRVSTATPDGEEVFRYGDRFSTNDMYVDEMKAFLDAIASGRRPESDLVNAARVLEIALRAKEASR